MAEKEEKTKKLRKPLDAEQYAKGMRPRKPDGHTHAKKRAKLKQEVSKEHPRKGKRAKKDEWKPNIIVFACNWCSYAGADNAGVSKIQQSPHFRIIRVMCSGRIEPSFVLRAFEKGADGVMVSGCHFGDCHYIFGNYKAKEQFEKTKKMCDILGLEEERLRLEWISAAEGARFAKIIGEFTKQIEKLGPSPFRKVSKEKRNGES